MKVMVELVDKPGGQYVRKLDHDNTFPAILLWEGNYYVYRADLSNTKRLIYVFSTREIKEVF